MKNNMVIVKTQPKDWEETTLGSVVEIIDGDRGINYPKNDEFSRGGYCLFLNTKNVPDTEFSFSGLAFISREKDEKMGKGRMRRGDFVLTTRGTIGNFAFYSDKISFENIRINSGMVILRVNEEILEKPYFRFYLRSPLFREQIIRFSSGSAQPQLPIRDLKSFVVCFPEDIDEQHAIASVLSSLDDKIELLRRQNESLEAMARAIFHEWFVAFNFPNERGKPYKASGGKMVASELGEIPEGWRVGKYEFLADVITGKGISKEKILDNGKYDILGANGRIGRTDDFLFDENLIITGRVGTLGNVFIVRSKVWVSDNVLISKPHRWFYFTFLTLRVFNFDALNRGSTQPLITQSDLKSVDIIIPSASVLDTFEALMQAIFSKIFQNDIRIQTLSQNRDTLLPKLMSGEVRVKI